MVPLHPRVDRSAGAIAVARSGGTTRAPARGSPGEAGFRTATTGPRRVAGLHLSHPATSHLFRRVIEFGNHGSHIHPALTPASIWKRPPDAASNVTFTLSVIGIISLTMTQRTHPRGIVAALRGNAIASQRAADQRLIMTNLSS